MKFAHNLAPTDTRKELRLKHRQRTYHTVTDETRQALIELLNGGNISLREASVRVGIPYNNAKVIYRVYRKEGRVKGTPKHLKRMVARFKTDPNLFAGREADPRYKEMMQFLNPE